MILFTNKINMGQLMGQKVDIYKELSKKEKVNNQC